MIKLFFIHLFDFFLLDALYLLLFYSKWKRKGKAVFSRRTAFFVYITLVLHLTLMPFRIPVPQWGDRAFLKTVNLTPFADIAEGADFAWGGTLLNVAMLMPFGWLLAAERTGKPDIPFGKEPERKWKGGFIKTILWSALFSLSIELTQLLYVWADSSSSRRCDITDFITNTAGGALGYIAWKIVCRISDFCKKGRHHV